MGKGGKGGGGSLQQPAIPPGMMQSAAQLGNIGEYESQFLNLPYSLGNWATNIATGGTGPQAASNPGEAGPTTNFFGPDINGPGGLQHPNLAIQNYGPNGQPLGIYNSFQGGITQPTSGGWTPGGTWSGVGTTAMGGSSNLPGWLADFEASLGSMENQAGQLPTGFDNNNTPGQYSGIGANQQIINELLGTPYIPATPTKGRYRPGTPAVPATTGDIAQSEYLQKTIGQPLTQEGDVLEAEGGSLYNQNLFGSNFITPQQQAWIDASTKASQQALAQQLGTQGLSGSSMATQLQGEAAQQGAVSKGQLQQENIALDTQRKQLAIQAQEGGLAAKEAGIQVQQNQEQLTQNMQDMVAKLGSSDAALTMQEQQQMFSMSSTIAGLSSSEQAQMFNEGLQGYGLMGTFMNAVTAPYGLQIQDFASILQAESQYTSAQAGIIESQNSAASQGMSGLFSGLASLFGGGGGSGGLLGGLIGGAGAGTGAAIGGSAAAGTVADLAPLVAGLAF